MTTYKAIVLDMDGTLVNTEKLWKVAEQDLLAAHGRQYDPVTHSEFLGLAVSDFIEAIRQAYDLTHVDADELSQELENRARVILAEQTEHVAGAIELIDYIQEQDIPCAIASNSSHVIIRATLRNQRWADPIVKRYSSDDVPNAKPAPDLYLHVAQQLGVDPKDCLAVEDSLNGVKAAITAGMTCLAVPDLELSDVETFKAVTPHVMQSLHEVLEFIKENG